MPSAKRVGHLEEILDGLRLGNHGWLPYLKKTPDRLFAPLYYLSMTQRDKAKKIYLVNRDFQFRYTRAAIVVGFFSTLLTTILILYPLYIFKILVIPQFLPLPILAAMALAAVLNMAFIGLLGVVLTHRIAGPMYSLVRQMRLVSQGRWVSHIQLRKHDDLKYVARNFNELVDGLVGLARQDVSMIDEVREQITGWQGRDLNRDDLDRLQSAVERLRERLAHRIETPKP